MTERSTVVDPSEKRPLQLPLFGLPVLCCSCHRLKSPNGRWSRRRVDHEWYPHTVFSHGICPSCLKAVYPAAYRRRHGGRAAARPLSNLFGA